MLVKSSFVKLKIMSQEDLNRLASPELIERIVRYRHRHHDDPAFLEQLTLIAVSEDDPELLQLLVDHFDLDLRAPFEYRLDRGYELRRSEHGKDLIFWLLTIILVKYYNIYLMQASILMLDIGKNKKLFCTRR